MKIAVQGVSKSFSDFPALNEVTMTIPEGSLMALLGPSGSGKTTLLRVIAGLEMPEQGAVFMEDVDVTHREIRHRHIGFVFQHYALFPTMSVARNIAFGLEVRHTDKRKITDRVEALVELMQLTGLEDRLPDQLSGGQRQRVALARALAPEPGVLLLDEPFGALDARVRQELRAWLRRLHDEIHVTTVFVTHDQEEAFEVADTVAVLNEGRVEQIGTPEALLDTPANAFVMDFIGTANRLDGVLDGTTARFGSLSISDCTGITSGDVTAFVRHSDLALQPVTDADSPCHGIVSSVRRVGLTTRVGIRIHNGPLLQGEFPQEQWSTLQCSPGTRVNLSLLRAQLFPRAAHF